MEQYIDVETGKVMPGTAAKQAKATRRTYTVDEKEAAVKEARHIGVAAAARKLDRPMDRGRQSKFSPAQR